MAGDEVKRLKLKPMGSENIKVIEFDFNFPRVFTYFKMKKKLKAT